MAKFLFSAPGRTEIGGNHTDHQHGRVLAAAVHLDTTGEVELNGKDRIRIQSEGYEPVEIRLDELAPREQEKNTTAALVRGIAAAFVSRGAVLKGFDAAVRSSVLPGSGLSSSAAFEVLMGTIMNHLFMGGALQPMEVAKIGQWAENVYFGKPCGLMDQTASAVGGMVAIDFDDAEHPVVERLEFDFSSAAYALCIIDSGADHADLTEEYASIPQEMKQVAACFGKTVLRDLPEHTFRNGLTDIRRAVSDRAILRATHFYRENTRVEMQIQALKQGDFSKFLKLVSESGRSSWMYLQNIMPAGAVQQQAMAVALALCDMLLEGTGAFRVHGGGFAGTVQAFVPFERLDSFQEGIDAVLGRNACRVLSIRSEGGIRLS